MNRFMPLHITRCRVAGLTGTSRHGRPRRCTVPAALALGGLLLLVAACSSPKTTGFVRPEVFEPGRRIAFSSDGPLSQALTGELGARGFRIVERARLVTVLNEQALQQTGLVDDARSLAAGRILRVDYLIDAPEPKPSFFGFGQNASSVVRILDVQTGEVAGSLNYTGSAKGFHAMPMMGGSPLGRDSGVEAARRIADAIMDRRKE